MNKTLFALGCVISVSVGAHGEIRNVYVNANKQSATTFEITTKAMWTETEGSTTPVTDPPTNATDFIRFPRDAHLRRLYSGTDDIASAKMTSFALAGLSGDILTTYVSSGFTPEYFQSTRQEYTVKIANPDGFEGRWLAGRLNANKVEDGFGPYQGRPMVIELTDATATHVPQLSHVWATANATVRVPDAGTLAKVTSVAGGGRFVKDGAGDLFVGRMDGAHTQVKIAAGTLALGGCDPESTGVVPGAAVHLDASAANCFKTYAGSDGRTYVTNWSPVAGTTVAATRITNYTQPHVQAITYAQDPFVSPVTSPGGLPLLDFGSCCFDNRPQGGSTVLEWDSTLGPSNCIMKLTADVKDIREVFVAYQPSYTNATSNLFNPVLGCSSATTPFLPYRPNILSSSDGDAVKMGDIRVNDNTYAYDTCPWDVYTPNKRAFRIVSIGTTNAVGTVNMLASDSYSGGRTGGLRIGEILIYTNELTSAQRTQINRYLKTKWFGERDYDAGPLHIAANAAIEVPAGKVVKVPSVHAMGATVIKKGAGRLIVDTVYPSTTTFDIRGGSVDFVNAPVKEQSGPATNALVWLDASAAGTVVREGANVTEWKDCRGSGYTISAVIPTENGNWSDHSEYPTLAENVAGDKPAIDTGTYGWMKLSTVANATASSTTTFTGKENAQSGFIVMRIKSGADNKNQPIFGGLGMDFVRGSTQKQAFIDLNNSSVRGMTAIWTRDGVPMDPLSTDAPEFDRFYVYHFSAMSKVFCDLIGKDRLYGIHGRGFEQIAELILYDRRLTVDEQRATELYLMKKWLGDDATHPAATTKAVTDLAFAADTPVVLDFDGDVTLGTVTGGNGSLVKGGDGTMTLSLDGLNTLTSIVVTAGSLVESSLTFMNEAVFHFDASAAGSLETYATEESDGSELTWVSKWNDVRNNGVQAQQATNNIDAALVPTNPTLQMVTMPDGVSRPTVDFGPYCKNESQRQSPWRSAAFDMSAKFRNIREVHSIYADTDTDLTRRQQQIFGDWSGCSFYRSLNKDAGLLDLRYCSAYINYTAIDGVSVEKTASLPEGFHLVSMAATNDVGTDAMALMYKQIGGSRISEEISFSRELTTKERQYLQQYLMLKWLGDASDARYDLSTLSVANGSSMTFADGVGVIATNVVGSGTVKATLLSVPGEMSVGEDDAPATFTVKGGLAFGAASELFLDWMPSGCDKVAVTGAVSGAPAICVAFHGVKPTVGDYVLMTAGDLSGIDVSALTLVTDLPAERQQRVSLVKVGNALVLRIAKRGLLMIVR